jgi:hypothetical protein
MSKLLVIDKSVFHQTVLYATYAKQLAEFVKSHWVVFPHALGVECVTSDDKNGQKTSKDPIRLMEKLVDLVKAGASIGLPPLVIFKQEKETRKAVDSVIDCRGSNVVRSSTISLTKGKIRKEAQEANRAFKPMINYCRQIAETLHSNLVQRDSLTKAFREKANQGNLLDRLELWIENTDVKRDEIVKSQLPAISEYVTDKDDQWFSWQLLRIYFAWGIEWASKRNQSGPSFRGDIENDFWDMEYVACLCKADGILTNDKKLVIPLVQTAFPARDVFSKIDDVPSDYQC